MVAVKETQKCKAYSVSIRYQIGIPQGDILKVIKQRKVDTASSCLKKIPKGIKMQNMPEKFSLDQIFPKVIELVWYHIDTLSFESHFRDESQ